MQPLNKVGIKRLYQRILQDPRHKGTRVLWKLPIETRAFGDWAMAFRELSDVDPARLAGYSQFLEDGFAGNAAGGDSSKAMTLMRLVGDVP